MNGIKDRNVASFLKKRVEQSEFTQADLARQLEIAQSVLSRQLQGKESIPIERITQLTELLKLPSEEVSQLNAMIVTEHDENTSTDFKQAALRASLVTVEMIGPDGLLLEILKSWYNYDRETKIKLLQYSYKLNDELDHDKKQK